jgi:uncharacterized protein (TIGR02145 family)
MILKYADGVDPFRGEVIGGVYQRYAAGEQMMSTKKNDRYPYALQWQRASTLIGITRYWRMLTGAQQTAWNDFAITYPQPTQWNPARFLNGYNLFCRWNFFNRLVNGQAEPILTEPDMSEVADTTLSPTITNDSGDLILDADWSRSGSDIWGAVFISRVVSAGNNYIASQPRFITGIDNSGGTTILNGLLYNFYAANNAANIAPVGFTIPAQSVYSSLATYLGGFDVAGKYLKDLSLDFWQSLGSLETNSKELFLRGNGSRDAASGVFSGLKQFNMLWCSNQYNSTNGYTSQTYYADYRLIQHRTLKRMGRALRACKSATGVSDGIKSSVTGNSGFVYSTVVINQQEWTQQNLCDTHFQNGTEISLVTDNATWYGTTSPGCCYYNNDASKGFISLPSSFDISAEYFNMFGRLPVSGEKVLMKVIKFNKISGQFLPEEEFFLETL